MSVKNLSVPATTTPCDPLGAPFCHEVQPRHVHRQQAGGAHGRAIGRRCGVARQFPGVFTRRARTRPRALRGDRSTSLAARALCLLTPELATPCCCCYCGEPLVPRPSNEKRQSGQRAKRTHSPRTLSCSSPTLSRLSPSTALLTRATVAACTQLGTIVAQDRNITVSFASQLPSEREIYEQFHDCSSSDAQEDGPVKREGVAFLLASRAPRAPLTSPSPAPVLVRRVRAPAA